MSRVHATLYAIVSVRLLVGMNFLPSSFLKTQKKECRTDRPTDLSTDGLTDGPTNTLTFTVACTRLKIRKCHIPNFVGTPTFPSVIHS